MGVELAAPDYIYLALIPIIGALVVLLLGVMMDSLELGALVGFGGVAIGLIVSAWMLFQGANAHQEERAAAIEEHYGVTLPDDPDISDGSRITVEIGDGEVRIVTLRVAENRAALLVEGTDGDLVELGTDAPSLS